MTWAKIDDRAIDGPTLLALPRGVRHMHIEGIVWCCRHETDGHIPRHAIGKVTDEPDMVDAAAQLVAAGLWAATVSGWEIVDFLAVQRSKEDIEKVKVLADARQRRHRQHQAGDHSLCDLRYCRAASRVAERIDNGVDNGPLTRPDPARPTGRKGEGKGAAGAAAPLGSRRTTAPGVPSRPRTRLVIEPVVQV